MGCESCGERPNHTSKDFTKAVVEINNPETLVLFRKVSLPASMGTEEDTPASIGKYHNVLLVYEANGHIYLYSSDGIPTLLSTEIGDLDDIIARISALEQQGTVLSDDIEALTNDLAAETAARTQADITLNEDVSAIEEKIPNQASAQNQLADKAFVNSSVATDTANYISNNGQPFNSLAELEAYSGTLTNNDYAFVVGTDQAGNTTYTRYKYVASAGEWAEEYVLNNSSFTAVQWAAINSDITSGAVDKLNDLANIQSIGANLSLVNGELSATDTTYSPFTGTDGTTAGTAGLVPAPATTDAGKVLGANGSWVTGGPTVVQTAGTSTADVMSQNAVTSMIFADGANAQKVAIGAQSAYSPNSYSTSIGYDALAGEYSVAIGGSNNASTRTEGTGSYSIAIGNNAKSYQFYGIALGASAKASTSHSVAIGREATATGARAVAIGSQSTTTSQGEVSFGGSSLAGNGYNNSQYRLLTNVYDPQNAHDAATKGYVDNNLPVTFTTNEWNALWA